MAKIMFIVLVTIIHGGEMFRVGDKVSQDEIPEDILKNLEARNLIKKLSPLPEKRTEEPKKSEKISEVLPPETAIEEIEEIENNPETGFKNPLDRFDQADEYKSEQVEEKKNSKKKGR